jgi:uncharacterized membrane protein HdeD (DUF308 family)
MTNSVSATVESGPSSTGTMVMGALLIILGLLTIAARVLISVTSVYLFGLVILLAGFVQLFQAFFRRSLGDFLLFLFFGILSIIVGFMILANPTASLVTVTMLLAVFFLVGGLFQIFSSIFSRYPNWGVTTLAGVVNVILGWMVFANWPVSGFTALGWLLGIGLIANGLSSVIAALGRSSQPKPAPRIRESVSYSEIKGGDKK